LATRLHRVGRRSGAYQPIVIHARAAKTLGAFWASTADYLPSYVNERGIARLEPPRSDWPQLVFIEDTSSPADGTAGITIEADELSVDVEALVRVGATCDSVDEHTNTAHMRDPEGNPFTVVQIEGAAT
jgi:hypothetical protein